MMSNVEFVPSAGVAVDHDDVAVDNTAGGIVLLEANPFRKGGLIINTGANAMRVTTDGSTPSPTHGKLVLSGAGLSLSSPYCPIAEVKAIQAGAGATTANASEVNGE
jgi:hypothetical protein